MSFAGHGVGSNLSVSNRLVTMTRAKNERPFFSEPSFVIESKCPFSLKKIRIQRKIRQSERSPPSIFASLHVDSGDCAGAARAATVTKHTRQHVTMQAITASNTLAAPKVAVRSLSARRTVKALAPRCVPCFIRVRGQ